MRLLVWGTSPEAGWLAGRFHQLDYDTLWLANEAIAGEVQRFGQLHLSSPLRSSTVEGLRIVTRPGEALKLPPAWIVLAMPTWAVAVATLEMVQHIPPERCPPILALLHGVGGLEKITAYFPAECVIQGVLTQTFRWPVLNDGSVAYESIASDGVGGVGLSENAQAQKIAHMLYLTGLGAVTVHEKTALCWSDVLWQIQANAVATLLDVAPEQVYADSRLFEIEYRQLCEAVRVIDRLGVKLVALPGVNVPRLAWQIRVLPKALLRPLLAATSKLPGLRSDLEQHTGHSDAAYLNGAIAQAAHRLGIGAPVNHILAISITDLAEGRAQRTQFHDSLDYLETLIRIASRHAAT